MSYELTGFDELIHALTNAPTEIRQQGFEIVRDETEGAATEIAQAYAAKAKTGNLASRVKTVYPAEAVLIGIVLSASPHAHLFEFGTKARQTKGGANRGVMPADRVTPVIAQRHRDRMYHRLSEMLERFGFQVGSTD